MRSNTYKWIRVPVIWFLVCAMAFTAGCVQIPMAPPETVPVDTTHQTPTETESPATEEAAADPSLVSLRQAMVETPKFFAVAYFGYSETVNTDFPVDPFGIMRENTPQLCQDLPFLTEIPRDRVIGATGELFCIVPLDEDATVVVSRGYWDEENQQCIYDDMIYSSTTGEPILLFCNAAGWEPDIQVYISGPSGEAYWYPQTDDNICAAPLRNDAGEDLIYDFSSYRELLAKRHGDLKGSEWVLPTAQTLAGTSWVWEGFLKDGREVKYWVSFEEGVLSVIWNDGINQADQQYLYAWWELTQEGDYAVLSIDFGDFAGILRYNLLYHEAYEELYLGLDVTREDMNLGWEPLYRFLMAPIVPEPTDMIGSWELAWIEVEGERVEAESGAYTIEIASAASAGLLMSYNSVYFPEDNFENALLTVDARQMYTLCGNDRWVADVDYVGPWDTTYAVTLTVDDILIKQNYFLLDGAPSVSYEYFHRVG